MERRRGSTSGAPTSHCFRAEPARLNPQKAATNQQRRRSAKDFERRWKKRRRRRKLSDARGARLSGNGGAIELAAWPESAELGDQKADATGSIGRPKPMAHRRILFAASKWFRFGETRRARRLKLMVSPLLLGALTLFVCLRASQTSLAGGAELVAAANSTSTLAAAGLPPTPISGPVRHLRGSAGSGAKEQFDSMGRSLEALIARRIAPSKPGELAGTSAIERPLTAGMGGGGDGGGEQVRGIRRVESADEHQEADKSRLLSGATDKGFPVDIAQGGSGSADSERQSRDDEPAEDDETSAEDDGEPDGSLVEADGSQPTLSPLTMGREFASSTNDDDDYSDYGAYVVYGQPGTTATFAAAQLNSSVEGAPSAPLKEANLAGQSGSGAAAIGHQSAHFQVIFFAAANGRLRGRANNAPDRTGLLGEHQVVGDDPEGASSSDEAPSIIGRTVNSSLLSFKHLVPPDRRRQTADAALIGSREVHYIGPSSSSNGNGAANSDRMERPEPLATRATLLSEPSAPKLPIRSSNGNVGQQAVSRSGRLARAQPSGARTVLQELEEDDVKWLNKMNEKGFTPPPQLSSSSVSPLSGDEQTTELAGDPQRDEMPESALSSSFKFKHGPRAPKPSSSLVKQAQGPNRAVGPNESLMNMAASNNGHGDQLDGKVAPPLANYSATQFEETQFGAVNKSAIDGAYSQAEQDHNVYYWRLIWLILPLGATFGNLLVIMAVYMERSLQSVTNYFIVSLAFADLFVGLVVMPFAVYVLVNEVWSLSETICDIYVAVDVTSSTASILNLVAISIDRYRAVAHPIAYSARSSSTRAILTIFLVWLISCCVGAPIILGLNTSPERKSSLCILYNSTFIFWSSLTSFYVPCFIMIGLYWRIFRAIKGRTRKAIQAGGPASSGQQLKHNKENESLLRKVMSVAPFGRKLQVLEKSGEHTTAADTRPLASTDGPNRAPNDQLLEQVQADDASRLPSGSGYRSSSSGAGAPPGATEQRAKESVGCEQGDFRPASAVGSCVGAPASAEQPSSLSLPVPSCKHQHQQQQHHQSITVYAMGALDRLQSDADQLGEMGAAFGHLLEADGLTSTTFTCPVSYLAACLDHSPAARQGAISALLGGLRITEPPPSVSTSPSQIGELCGQASEKNSAPLPGQRDESSISRLQDLSENNKDDVPGSSSPAELKFALKRIGPCGCYLANKELDINSDGECGEKLLSKIGIALDANANGKRPEDSTKSSDCPGLIGLYWLWSVLLVQSSPPLNTVPPNGKCSSASQAEADGIFMISATTTIKPLHSEMDTSRSAQVSSFQIRLNHRRDDIARRDLQEAPLIRTGRSAVNGPVIENGKEQSAHVNEPPRAKLDIARRLFSDGGLDSTVLLRNKCLLDKPKPWASREGANGTAEVTCCACCGQLVADQPIRVTATPTTLICLIEPLTLSAGNENSEGPTLSRLTLMTISSDAKRPCSSVTQFVGRLDAAEVSLNRSRIVWIGSCFSSGQSALNFDNLLECRLVKPAGSGRGLQKQLCAECREKCLLGGQVAIGGGAEREANGADLRPNPEAKLPKDMPPTGSEREANASERQPAQSVRLGQPDAITSSLSGERSNLARLLKVEQKVNSIALAQRAHSQRPTSLSGRKPGARGRRHCHATIGNCGAGGVGRRPRDRRRARSSSSSGGSSSSSSAAVASSASRSSESSLGSKSASASTNLHSNSSSDSEEPLSNNSVCSLSNSPTGNGFDWSARTQNHSNSSRPSCCGQQRQTSGRNPLVQSAGGCLVCDRMNSLSAAGGCCTGSICSAATTTFDDSRRHLSSGQLASGHVEGPKLPSPVRTSSVAPPNGAESKTVSKSFQNLDHLAGEAARESRRNRKSSGTVARRSHRHHRRHSSEANTCECSLNETSGCLVSEETARSSSPRRHRGQAASIGDAQPDCNCSMANRSAGLRPSGNTRKSDKINRSADLRVRNSSRGTNGSGRLPVSSSPGDRTAPAGVLQTATEKIKRRSMKLGLLIKGRSSVKAASSLIEQNKKLSSGEEPISRSSLMAAADATTLNTAAATLSLESTSGAAMGLSSQQDQDLQLINQDQSTIATGFNSFSDFKHSGSPICESGPPFSLTPADVHNHSSTICSSDEHKQLQQKLEATHLTGAEQLLESDLLKRGCSTPLPSKPVHLIRSVISLLHHHQLHQHYAASGQNHEPQLEKRSHAKLSNNKKNRTSGASKKHPINPVQQTVVRHRAGSRRRREKNAARRERKATKTLAIVLGIFLICWTPFFTCNIIDGICIQLNMDCRPGMMVYLITSWLGYINSCVNPIIYTIFNMEFRRAFKKLLTTRPKCLD